MPTFRFPQRHCLNDLLAALAVLVAIVLAQPVAAQESQSENKLPDDKNPPALTHYKGREIAVTMHFTGAPWLVRDEREREERASEMIAALGVKPGQVVCDLGCGNGYHALML